MPPHYAVCIDVSAEGLSVEVKNAAVKAALARNARIFLFGTDPEWMTPVPLSNAVDTLHQLESCPALTAKCTEARVCQMLGYTQGYLVNTPWTFMLLKLRKEVTNSMARTMMPSPRDYKMVYVTTADATTSDVYGNIAHDLDTVESAFVEFAGTATAADAPEAAAAAAATPSTATKSAATDFMGALFSSAMPFVQQAMESQKASAAGANAMRKKKGIKAPSTESE